MNKNEDLNATVLKLQERVDDLVDVVSVLRLDLQRLYEKVRGMEAQNLHGKQPSDVHKDVHTRE